MILHAVRRKTGRDGLGGRPEERQKEKGEEQGAVEPFLGTLQQVAATLPSGDLKTDKK